MKRRSFLTNLAKATSAFMILPGAGRIWKNTNKDTLIFGYDLGPYSQPTLLQCQMLNAGCSLTRATLTPIGIADLNRLVESELQIAKQLDVIANHASPKTSLIDALRKDVKWIDAKLG